MVICILENENVIYFGKNGSELSTRRKSIGVKTIAPLERAGKNVPCFFLRDSEYDYERVTVLRGSDGRAHMWKKYTYMYQTQTIKTQK